ncbi:MAG TPA: hypothetical protein VK453_27360 [Micromonosporaceae bacterium]|nr:hypothetical protein [Micromonosporaceae bacterium]
MTKRGYLIAAVVAATVLGAAPGPVSAAAAPDVAGIAQGTRATYASPVKRADGRVDTPATIDRLQAAHANTYAFLVKGQADWDDLSRDFVPAAQQAGIKVWVYLLPPSECPPGPPPDYSCSTYAPHKNNYVAWGKAVAELSQRYPTVTAWAVDDFTSLHNVSHFTPAYVAEMRRTTAAIQPALDFYPLVYVDAVNESFLLKYEGLIDGLIMPYRDGAGRNTLWTGALGPQLDVATALLDRHGLKAVLMVFAKGFGGTTVQPDVEYVRTVTSIGMEYTRDGRLAGVIQYQLPLTGGTYPGRHLAREPGNGSLVFTVHPAKRTIAGASAAAGTVVQLDAGSTSCKLKFWHTDDRNTGAPAGYHLKQALVNKTVVWTRDVASDGDGWFTAEPIELAPLLTDGSAPLTFRLREARAVEAYPVLARIDDIGLTGCHIANPTLETPGGWTFSRTDSTVLAGQWIYDPAYLTSVFDAVAALYSTG